MKVTDFVKGGNIAMFHYYRAGYFYYLVSRISETGHLEFYKFPIPLDELGEASLNHSEKAILLMRYIRKAIEENTMIKVEDIVDKE